MQKHKIATFGRFMYLNSYAFLLLFMAIGIAIIPLWKISWWLLIPQIIAFIPCAKGAFSIFASWNDKKRKYNVLIQKNKDLFRPDTFTEYMQAPCGRLLTQIVLNDLEQKEEYQQLKKLRKPFFTNIKENCKPQKTVIHINPDIK